MTRYIENNARDIINFNNQSNEVVLRINDNNRLLQNLRAVGRDQHPHELNNNLRQLNNHQPQTLNNNLRPLNNHQPHELNNNLRPINNNQPHELNNNLRNLCSQKLNENVDRNDYINKHNLANTPHMRNQGAYVECHNGGWKISFTVNVGGGSHGGRGGGGISCCLL